MTAGKGPLWAECPGCDNPWCRLHGVHAHDCECPSVDEMDFDPYVSGGPPPGEGKEATLGDDAP